jgi:hypothetical protein
MTIEANKVRKDGWLVSKSGEGMALEVDGRWLAFDIDKQQSKC